MYFHDRQRCKQKSMQVELPKKYLSSSNMCINCSIIWSKCVPKVRVDPGQNPSASAKKIIRSRTENQKISIFGQKLLKKILRNKDNKVILKCQRCCKVTKASYSKPERLNIDKKEVVVSNLSMSQKKKKKKAKDKSAGLNLSNVQNVSNVPEEAENKKNLLQQSTPPIPKIISLKSKDSTPLQKLKKLNLSKLSSAKKQTQNTTQRKNLNSFLQELF